MRVLSRGLDYARGVTVLSSLREGVQARGGRQTLSLLASVPLRIDGDRAVARFVLRQGESVSFVLAYGHGRPVRVGTYRTEARLEDTRRFWQEIVAGIRYDGAWTDAVKRSLLVLHLMMYRRTGAIIAAPTTSPAGDPRWLPQLGLSLRMAEGLQLHGRHPISVG